MKDARKDNEPRITTSGLAEDVCVALVDDDPIYLAGLGQFLSQDLRIRVVASGTHEEAVAWGQEIWDGFDTVFVDIHDESALAVVGEDMYRGITVLELVKQLPVRTVAIVPTSENPLVNLRLAESGADEVFLRAEICDGDTLVRAAREADPSRAARLHNDDVLAKHGARKTSRPNRVVRLYRGSALFGKLHLVKQVRLERHGVSRRQMAKLPRELDDSGFKPPPNETIEPRRTRWPEARLIVLKIIGREHVDDEPLPNEASTEGQ